MPHSFENAIAPKFSHLQRILDFTTQNTHLGQEKSGAREIKTRFDAWKIKNFTSDKNEARDFCVNLQFLQSFGSDSA